MAKPSQEVPRSRRSLPFGEKTRPIDAAEVARVRALFPKDMKCSYSPDEGTFSEELEKAMELRDQIVQSIKNRMDVTYTTRTLIDSESSGQIRTEAELDMILLRLDEYRLSLLDREHPAKDKYGKKVEDVKKTEYVVEGRYDEINGEYVASVTIEGLGLVEAIEDEEIVEEIDEDDIMSGELVVVIDASTTITIKQRTGIVKVSPRT